ncbi:condensation domain-containing protein, partial [Micromonospora inaquosa]
RVLADVWAQVLRVQRVGVHDNFFELGGDSILAVQIIGALDRFGLTVTLDALFRAPTVSALGATLTAATPHQPLPEPFELLTEQERVMLPPGVEDAYPMTATQLGMYLQNRLHGNSRIYHNLNSLEVTGRLDPDAFTAAVEAAVARTPALRTGFAVDGLIRPLQLVHATAPADVTCADLTGFTEAEQEVAIEKVIADELADPFEPSRPPQIRFRLLRRAADRFQLLVVESHLIVDGWSFTSLLAEIFEDHWSILTTGSPVDRPPLRSSFAEFVRLEQAAITSDESRRFWARQVADAPPTRLADLAEQEGELTIARQPVEIPLAVERGLRELANRLGVPLKSVLLAAHLRVLAGLLGAREVVSGMVTHGRPEGPDGDRIKGLFLNTVPIRLALGSGSWSDIVRMTHRAEVDLLPHRRYPLGRILRDLHRSELFDASFHFVTFHELKRVFHEDSPWVIRPDSRSSENTHFRLMAAFSVHPPADRLGLVLVHDEVTLGRHIGLLADAYQRALAALAFDADAAHASFSLLERAESWALGGSIDDSAGVVPSVRSWVERSPDATAVVAGDVRWTYAELWRRSGVVAARLAESGVGRGSFVGIGLPRSADLIPVLLGVLRSGAAYVPLPPWYPADRLRFMIEDVGVSLVVGALDDADVPVLPTESLWSGDVPVGPVAELSAADPAYVIYTSGSTGRPKGVVVTHGNLGWLLASTRPVVRPGPDDVWSVFHSYAFDVSVFEIWGALASGGAAVVVGGDVVRSPQAFGR